MLALIRLAHTAPKLVCFCISGPAGQSEAAISSRLKNSVAQSFRLEDFLQTILNITFSVHATIFLWSVNKTYYVTGIHTFIS